MAFFFNNKCQYSGCGEKFGSLAELIQHVERVHVVINENEEVSKSEMMVPLSKILPNNIHDVMMRPPVHRINRGPRLRPPVAALKNINCGRAIQMMNGIGAASSLQSALATDNVGISVNQSNYIRQFQLLNAIGSNGAGPSLQFVLTPTIVNSSAISPFQVPMVSTKSNNCVPPSKSVVIQAKHGAIPKARMQSMGLGGNRDVELPNDDDIPSSSSKVKEKNNSSKMSSLTKRMSSINFNAVPSMAKTNDASTQPTSTSPPPKFNDTTHIALSGLTPDEIVQNSVLRADHSKLKPFPCPIRGCKKRYKNLNGIKYHAESYERELEKNRIDHKSN
ncbi:uncharacterized protein LOC119687369 [Teleopsis dalmanni]|uniref:uncharacterized protein LOC119687369 n=1 Tax=Teleopsis dalmanni TaxID=139649 RepID=UPI0018CF7CB8|nr:uncharacterized protein LOC119687369 [Teleopsis dalmanni]